MFPTLGHPPRYVLMGGNHPRKPSDDRKSLFPRLWHQKLAWEHVSHTRSSSHMCFDGGKHPRKPSDVIFPTVVAPGVKPRVVALPHQSIIFLGPTQWAPGPKQWVGCLIWGHIYICSLHKYNSKYKLNLCKGCRAYSPNIYKNWAAAAGRASQNIQETTYIL